MSRSYRTDPKWKIAARNIKRDKRGRPVLPRIVVRRPRIGDCHPIPKERLVWFLRQLPIELYYGLRLIEMRPRQGLVGQPFASYSSSAKTIRLYSMPLTMHMHILSSLLRFCVEESRCAIEEQNDGFLVTWKDPDSLGFWFCYDVFLHELGHHLRTHYPCKTGRPHRRSEEELLATHDAWWTWRRRSRRKPRVRGRLPAAT